MSSIGSLPQSPTPVRLFVASNAMTSRDDSFRRFRIGKDDVGRRLDRVARKFLSGHSLGAVFGAIRRGDIRINSEKAKGDYRLKDGDELGVLQSMLLQPGNEASGKASAPPNSPPMPPWFNASILIENENVLALGKPAGVLVHGDDSLNAAVRAYLHSSLPGSLSFAPGPLHRLDRNTSGVILFGKSLQGATRFSSLLRSHSIRKDYLALVEGSVEGQATWTNRLERDKTRKTTVQSESGRGVECRILPLCAAPRVSLILVSMESGFTHQIRAQAALNGHPLLGDRKYGARRASGHYLLHAWRLVLRYNDSVLGFRTLSAPIPENADKRLVDLFGRAAVDRALGQP